MSVEVRDKDGKFLGSVTFSRPGPGPYDPEKRQEMIERAPELVACLTRLLQRRPVASVVPFPTTPSPKSDPTKPPTP